MDFHGVCPVIPTLFLDSEEIDFDGMGRLIDSVIGFGVQGVAMFGVGSEFFKLADAERSRLLDFFIAAVRRRVRTIVSVTAHSTLLACRQAAEAAQAGADALMLLPPFFGGPDGASVLRHIRDVMAAAPLPVVLQYAPEETKLGMSAQDFLELAGRSGADLLVKVEAKPAGPLVSRLAEAGIKVLVGKGGLAYYEALERGAAGVMPGCSLADRFVAIDELFRRGEKRSAFDAHNRIVPYLSFVDQSVEFFLAAEKYFLAARGLLAASRCRRPFFTLEGLHRQILDRYFVELGYGSG